MGAMICTRKGMARPSSGIAMLSLPLNDAEA
jgi:hypothetical protein